MAETIYTVGHSTHSLEAFFRILTLHGITTLADVRSRPYSRMNPQFNREPLQAALDQAGIGYVFLGRQLGARSNDPNCYIDGRVDYDRLAATDDFHEGLELLNQRLAASGRIALMCAEKDPLTCHRTILVARRLEEVGVDVKHILEDGNLESHSKAMTRLLGLLGLPESDLIHTREEMWVEAYYRQGRRIAFELDPENEAKLREPV